MNIQEQAKYNLKAKLRARFKFEKGEEVMFDNDRWIIEKIISRNDYHLSPKHKQYGFCLVKGIAEKYLHYPIS